MIWDPSVAALLKPMSTASCALTLAGYTRVTRHLQGCTNPGGMSPLFGGYPNASFKGNIANYLVSGPLNYLRFWAWVYRDHGEVVYPRHMLFDILGISPSSSALATHFPAGLPIVLATSDKPLLGSRIFG